MTTILITLLLISILYLIFAIKDLKDDVSDIEFRMDILKEVCADYEKRIKELENVRQTEVKRRKSADKYSRVLETAISKCSVYCNNGWSISKALLTKAQGKAYRLFERSVRPAYIRAKRNVQWLVYRAKERQEVISLQRAKDIHSERFR
jgi:hypothetical protein